MATKDKSVAAWIPIAETSSPTTEVFKLLADTEAASRPPPDLGLALQNLNEVQGRMSWAQKLIQCSHATGGYVQIDPRYSYMPFLAGTDGRPVFIFQLVEAIDEFIDYDRLVEEYPLTYGQINAVFSFLRKVASVNGANVDVDEIEEQADELDAELISGLRAGLADQEVVRVLDFA